MEKEKMNLTRAKNLTTQQLEVFMKNNLELYDYIVGVIINQNIENELESLYQLEGIEIQKVMFGSVYANDYQVDIIDDIEEFLNNDFGNLLWLDNETFYETLEKLQQDKNNNTLLNDLLNLMFQEIDERATFDGYSINEVVNLNYDDFDNYFNEYEVAVDLNTFKAYNSYELEQLDIDYQDLDWKRNYHKLN